MAHRATAFDYLYCTCGQSLRVPLEVQGDDPKGYTILVDARDEMTENETLGTFVPLTEWWARRHRSPLCRPCNADEFQRRESELSLLDALWLLDSSECPDG